MRDKLLIVLCAFACSACGPKAGSFTEFGKLPITTARIAALSCESGGKWAKSDITGTRIVISGVLTHDSFAGLTNMVGNGSVTWLKTAVPRMATFVDASGACQQQVLARPDSPVYVYRLNEGSIWMNIEINGDTRQFAGFVVTKVRGKK